MADDNAFGEYLQRLRADLGLSRQELADAAGLSYPYISQLERGFKTERGVRKRPSETALWQLSGPLGVPVEQLASRADVPLTRRTTERAQGDRSAEDHRRRAGPASRPTRGLPQASGRGAGGHNELEDARAEVLPALRRLLMTYTPATRLALLSQLQTEAVDDLTAG